MKKLALSSVIIGGVTVLALYIDFNNPKVNSVNTVPKTLVNHNFKKSNEFNLSENLSQADGDNKIY